MPYAAIKEWRTIMRDNFTCIDKLADFLELDAAQRSLLAQRPRFTLNVPRRLAAKMRKGTLDDPLLRQFVPLAEEGLTAPCFVADPVDDTSFRKRPKLLKKYQGRALLLCTSACAMHCRYCFRQNFDYEVMEKGFADELAAIAEDSTLKEVILSGGDPLSLADSALDALLTDLSHIPHVTRVRFHSRFPVGIPERIDSDFVAMLQRHRFAYWFIVHINHAEELDSEVAAALKKLLTSGIPVLNQAVLLRGVNDSIEAQAALSEALINNGVAPYYLHQLDRVAGAHRFEVEEEEGREIVRALASLLPGYGVPKYVREISGQPSKTPL